MFVDERFPPDISLAAVERIRHSTTAVKVNSGASSRNQNWQFPLREFDVSHAARIQSYMAQVIAFNLAVAKGMANTFRYKAWGDFTVSTGEGVFVSLTSTTFQMYKRYTFGAYSSDRKITLPVSGTVDVLGGGSYAVDYSTGIVTKVSGATPTGWTGEFDVPAYMGADLNETVIKDRSGRSLVMGQDQILIMEDRV